MSKDGFAVMISLVGVVVQLIISLVTTTRTARETAREEIERINKKDYRRKKLR